MAEARAAGRRAVVIGGSVGGLFIANMLLRQGWQVDVFERVGEGLASRGLGIARHGELLSILAAAGVREEGPPGIAVTGRSAFDKSGKVIARFDYPQHLGAWSGVFNPLHAAFPGERYHLGRELVGIEHRSDKIVACFADGARVEADLVIGADGFRSTVRALCAPEVRPSYAGYVAWRGIMEERDLSAEFRAHTFDQFAFCFPLRSQFIGYPVPGTDDSVERSRRRYSFLWYYPVAPGDELTDVLTDATGHTHEYSIPPPLIRPVHIQRLKENADRAAAAAVRRGGRALRAAHGAADLRRGVDPHGLRPHRARRRRGVRGEAPRRRRRAQGRRGRVRARALPLRPARRSLPRSSRYQSTRLPVARDTVRLGRRLGAFIERGLEGPWSDPDLGLVPQTIIRVSARPVAHLEHADVGLASADNRKQRNESLPV